jgi:hypothetical protein
MPLVLSQRTAEALVSKELRWEESAAPEKQLGLALFLFLFLFCFSPGVQHQRKI